MQVLTTAPLPLPTGGEHPSYADVQMITTIERLVASVLYWKGLHVRASSMAPARFEHLERWLTAFEARPSYLATKGIALLR